MDSVTHTHNHCFHHYTACLFSWDAAALQTQLQPHSKVHDLSSSVSLSQLHDSISVCVCVCEALTWVAVSEQGADGQQDLGDGEGGTPVVLQDVQTDHALTVDVAVVDPRTERHLITQVETP